MIIDKDNGVNMDDYPYHAPKYIHEETMLLSHISKYIDYIYELADNGYKTGIMPNATQWCIVGMCKMIEKYVYKIQKIHSKIPEDE